MFEGQTSFKPLRRRADASRSDDLSLNRPFTMSSPLARLLKTGLQRQVTRGLNSGRESAIWAFPVLVTAGWLLYPCLNHEWLIDIGMEPDPDAGVAAVHAAREDRMAARQKASGKSDAEEEEEEEEEVADEVEEEEEPAPEVEEEAPAPEEEDVGANGAADADEDTPVEEEEEEEEEEGDESEIVIKPLYTKSTEATSEATWDNFTIKAIRMSEDDDDDDEDDDDDDDE